MKILVDHSLCTGCRLCQLACSLRQFGENNPRKSAIQIKSTLLEDGHYRIALCDQCGDCQEVCPTGGIQRVDGAYRLDRDDCVWCMLCASACEKGGIVAVPGEQAPVLCTVCGDCAEICPTGALVMAE